MKTGILLALFITTVSFQAARASGPDFHLRCRPFKVHESYVKFERESGIRLREIVVEQEKDENPRLTLVQDAAIGGFGKDIEKTRVRIEGSPEKGLRVNWDQASLQVVGAGRSGGRREFTGSLSLKPGTGFFVSCELK